MKQLYTEQDIVRFLYDEMDEEEYASFFEVLCKDPELWEVYEQLKATQEELIFPDFTPSLRSEEFVLDAARLASLEMGEAKVENTRKQKESNSFRNISLTISLVLIVAGGISAWSELSLKNLFPTSTENLGVDQGNQWIHSRINGMEDARILPMQVAQNQYHLVSYSGQKVYKFTAAHP